MKLCLIVTAALLAANSPAADWPQWRGPNRDGVVTGGEECDCGDGTGTTPATCPGPNDNPGYTGCTSQCKWGPYCGDGVVNGPEACDDGPANGGLPGRPGCTFLCTKAAYCGDGIAQASTGEECDSGPDNGSWSTPCDLQCNYILQ